MKRICVFAGSSAGARSSYRKAAEELGRTLAQRGLGVVFGGGRVGLMGVLADAALGAGGEVIGVIPKFLKNREHMMTRGKVIVTRDMHERKLRMFEQADAFVALPGGIGTLEELVEQMTWVQLGRHKKPIALANVNKFWDPLCALLNHMQELRFIRSGLEVNYLVAERVEDILPMLTKAAAALSEADKAMTAVNVEQM